MRESDVAGGCAILCHPRAMGWFESVAELHRRELLAGAYKVWADSQDHGCFPLACVAHLVLVQGGVDFVGFGAEQPIGAEKKEQVLALTMLLAQFEGCLASGNVVSPVSVNEDDASK